MSQSEYSAGRISGNECIHDGGGDPAEKNHIQRLFFLAILDGK